MKTALHPSYKTNSRVMVVDDSLTVRKLVLKPLESEGFSVTECSNGKDALKALDSQFYDLLFLDYILPDMTAEDFLNELVANINYARLPVILMSSKHAAISRLSDYQNNVFTALTKPFTQEAAIKTALSALNLGQSDTAAGQQPTSLHGSLKKPELLQSGKSQSEPIIQKIEQELKRVAIHIPALEQKRNGVAPMDFYLPFLLHPKLIEGIRQKTDTLLLNGDNSQAPTLAGQCTPKTLFFLISDISQKKLSGCLKLISKDGDVEIHIHKGKAIGVSSANASLYTAGLDLDLTQFDASAVETAIQIQESSGIPILISLKPKQSLSTIDTEVLKSAATKLINEVTSLSCIYQFHEGQTAPEWASNASINTDIADLIVESLRCAKGWKKIYEELGELSNHFVHYHAVSPSWMNAHLSSFEAVIYSYYKYGYSISELAAVLDESPSRIAEATFILHKIGILTKLPEAEKKTDSNCNEASISALIISSNEDLIHTAISCIQDDKIQLNVCKNTCSALEFSNLKKVDLIITDGSSKDNHKIESVEKIRTINPNVMWVYAEPEAHLSHLREVIDLQPCEIIERPFNMHKAANSLSNAIKKAQKKQLHSSETEHNNTHLEIVNSRIETIKKQLESNENDLQQRENELIRNEELFYLKCNVFEEERARLDVMNDQIGQIQQTT